jgi:hypothetical protein
VCADSLSVHQTATSSTSSTTKTKTAKSRSRALKGHRPGARPRNEQRGVKSPILGGIAPLTRFPTWVETPRPGRIVVAVYVDSALSRAWHLLRKCRLLIRPVHATGWTSS